MFNDLLGQQGSAGSQSQREGRGAWNDTGDTGFVPRTSRPTAAGFQAASAFGPFADDMGKIAAGFTEAQRRTIADWIGRTTDALVANTQRIMSLDRASVR